MQMSTGMEHVYYTINIKYKYKKEIRKKTVPDTALYLHSMGQELNLQCYSSPVKIVILFLG